MKSTEKREFWMEMVGCGWCFPEDWETRYMTRAACAEMLGYAPTWVSRLCRILGLPPGSLLTLRDCCLLYLGLRFARERGIAATQGLRCLRAQPCEVLGALEKMGVSAEVMIHLMQGWLDHGTPIISPNADRGRKRGRSPVPRGCMRRKDAARILGVTDCWLGRLARSAGLEPRAPLTPEMWGQLYGFYAVVRVLRDIGATQPLKVVERLMATDDPLLDHYCTMADERGWTDAKARELFERAPST